MATVSLGSKTPGDIVKVKESGVPVEFYVAAQDYESGLNGAGRTLLVRKDCYDKRQWDAGGVNAYSGSDLDLWLTGEYQSLLDSNVRSALSSNKIYYTPGNKDMSVQVFDRAIFQLSYTELGASTSGLNVEGQALPIASILKDAYLSGESVSQWTRSPYTPGTDQAWATNPTGSASPGRWWPCTESRGSRPAFTLPADTLVDDDGNVIFNQPPSTPTLTVAPVVAGKDAIAVWTASVDPEGKAVSYVLEKSPDGTTGWSEIYSGQALTYSYIATEKHFLRVKAVDADGISSEYSNIVTVFVTDASRYGHGVGNAVAVSGLMASPVIILPGVLYGRAIGGFPSYNPEDWVDLKPENIRAGVTITPPKGDPVTGSVITYGDLVFSAVKRSAKKSFLIGKDTTYCAGGNSLAGSGVTNVMGLVPTGRPYAVVVTCTTPINPPTAAGVTFYYQKLTARYPNQEVYFGITPVYTETTDLAISHGMIPANIVNSHCSITVWSLAEPSSGTLAPENILVGKVINGVVGVFDPKVLIAGGSLYDTGRGTYYNIADVGSSSFVGLAFNEIPTGTGKKTNIFIASTAGGISFDLVGADTSSVFSNSTTIGKTTTSSDEVQIRNYRDSFLAWLTQ